MSHRCLIVFAAVLIVAVGVAAEELAPPPALAESSEVSVHLSFPELTPTTEIYRAVGEATGVEVIFDPRLHDRSISIEIDTSTTSEALDLVSAAAGDLWQPAASNAVIVADDTPQNHRQYEPIIVRSFVLEDGSVREADKLLRAIGNVKNLSVNEALGSITVRETAGKMPIIEHLVASVDHPPGEIDALIELLRLPDDARDDPPSSRFTAGQYATWRKTGGAVKLADSTLGLVGASHANLHLGSMKSSDVGLDLRLEGRVHAQSRDVTLEVRAVLSPAVSRSSEKSAEQPTTGRIETSARLTGGSTLLLRVPGAQPGDVVIAITPTIIRITEFDPEQLAAVWAGTETRIQASR